MILSSHLGEGSAAVKMIKKKRTYVGSEGAVMVWCMVIIVGMVTASARMKGKTPRLISSKKRKNRRKTDDQDANRRANAYMSKSMEQGRRKNNASIASIRQCFYHYSLHR